MSFALCPDCEEGTEATGDINYCCKCGYNFNSDHEQLCEPMGVIREEMERIDEVEAKLQQTKGALYDLAYELHQDGYDDPMEHEGDSR